MRSMPGRMAISSSKLAAMTLLNALAAIGRGEALLDPALTQKVFKRVREASRKATDEAFAALYQTRNYGSWL